MDIFQIVLVSVFSVLGLLIVWILIDSLRYQALLRGKAEADTGLALARQRLAEANFRLNEANALRNGAYSGIPRLTPEQNDAFKDAVKPLAGMGNMFKNWESWESQFPDLDDEDFFGSKNNKNKKPN